MEENSMPKIVIRPHLRPIEDLLKDPLLLIYKHWAPLLIVQVIMYALIAVIGVISVLVFLGPVVYKLIEGARTWAEVGPTLTGFAWIGLVFFFVLMSLVTSWGYVSMIAAVGHRGEGMAPLGEVFGRGFKFFFPFFIMSVLVMFAYLGGFVLLFFPAMILGVGVSLAWYIKVLEEVSIFQALGTSWQITKGLKWSIFGRLILLMLVLMGVQMFIGMIGFFPLIQIILFPIYVALQFVSFAYVMAYFYCIYEDIRGVRKDVYSMSASLTVWMIIFWIVAFAFCAGMVGLAMHLVQKYAH